jgi:hypothetical protein
MRVLRCSSGSSVSISKKLFIGGNLNGYVGSTIVGFDELHGSIGYGSRNQKGGIS